MVSETTFYVIKSQDGLYYRPGYRIHWWRSSFNRAKVYLRLGDAKSAITYKLAEWEAVKAPWHAAPSQECRDQYERFITAEIIPIGKAELHE